MNNSDTDQLIERVRQGDAQAFEHLLEEYYLMMYKIAYQWCGNRQDAEDITQNACIKLGRAIKSFRGDSSFSSWLYVLVINTGKDWFRQQRRHAHPEQAPVDSEAADEGWDPVMTDELTRHIGCLPSTEKEALLLVCGGGMTHREAAHSLGVKESTVSWRIHEARKKLARYLGE